MAEFNTYQNQMLASSGLEYPPNVTVTSPIFSSPYCHTLEADFPWLAHTSTDTLAHLEAGIEKNTLIQSPSIASFVSIFDDPLDFFDFGTAKNFPAHNDVKTEQAVSDIQVPHTSTLASPPDVQSDVSINEVINTDVDSPGSSRRSSSSSGFYSMTSPESSEADRSPAPSVTWPENSNDSCLPCTELTSLETKEQIAAGNTTDNQTASPSPKVQSPINIESESKKTDTAKPTASYVELIARALLTAPNYRMILADIYGFILGNFPYYETARSTWRNAVRHNLCVNDCFIKAGRSNSGRGFYWAIHPACVDMFKKGDFRRHQARKLAQQMVPVHNSQVARPASWGTTTINHAGLQLSHAPYMTSSGMTTGTTAPPNVYISQNMNMSTGAYGTHVPVSYSVNNAHHMQMSGKYLTGHASQAQPTNYYNQYYSQAALQRQMPTQHTMYQ